MDSFRIRLRSLEAPDRERFIARLEHAFTVAAEANLGPLSESAIPRADIERSLDAPKAEAFEILCDGNCVGGVIVVIDEATQINSLELFFVDPQSAGRGLGFAAWQAVVRRYPRTRVWKTATPYFDKRNIHFYVNKCGFRITEFINPRHPDKTHDASRTPGMDCYFYLEKTMCGSGN